MVDNRISAADMSDTHRLAFDGARGWSEAEFAALLEGPGCFAVGDAQCFALVRVVLDEAELLTLATRPEARRQGLARKCMTAWIAKARSMGAESAFLEVAQDNRAARSLYHDFGFAEVGRRPAYYPRPDGQSIDALLLRRKLICSAPPAL